MKNLLPAILLFFCVACSDATIPAAPAEEPVTHEPQTVYGYNGTRVPLIDFDGDGRISSDEFTRANAPASDTGAILLFQRFDTDGDGFLSADQFPIQPSKESHAIQK